MHECNNRSIAVYPIHPFVITAPPVLRVKRVREPIPAYLEGGRGYTLGQTAGSFQGHRAQQPVALTPTANTQLLMKLIWNCGAKCRSHSDTGRRCQFHTCTLTLQCCRRPHCGVALFGSLTDSLLSSTWRLQLFKTRMFSSVILARVNAALRGMRKSCCVYRDMCAFCAPRRSVSTRPITPHGHVAAGGLGAADMSAQFKEMERRDAG